MKKVMAYVIGLLIVANISMFLFFRSRFIKLSDNYDLALSTIKSYQQNILNLQDTNNILNINNSVLTSQIYEYENMYKTDFYAFPLPEKYKNHISSDSGYRETEELSAGGVDFSSCIHNGIDYACPDKTPVYAAKDGTVIVVYPGYYNGSKWQGDPVYGGLIILQHSDNSVTIYGHLSYTEVKTGNTVTAGQQIGLSGGVKGRRASGSSTGPHLHFAILPYLPDMFKTN